ncbi:hypothetical protein GH141_05245, partial [bacterium]|nr:hypothetical protein [bacterium]
MRTINAEEIRQQTRVQRYERASKCPHFAVESRCPESLEWHRHFCTHPEA